MADKEWYTQREISDMLGVDIRRVYPVVTTLRRLGNIQTTVDPTDERVTLVHASGIAAIRKALRLPDSSTATA